MNAKLKTLTLIGLYANLADEVERFFIDGGILSPEPIGNEIYISYTGLTVDHRNRAGEYCTKLRTLSITALSTWGLDISRKDLHSVNEFCEDIKTALENDPATWNDYLDYIIEYTKDFAEFITHETRAKVVRALLLTAEALKTFVDDCKRGNHELTGAFNLSATFNRILNAGKGVK